MQDGIERFDIEKANELLKVYKEKRHRSKISFLNELISYQNFFGDKSILNCDLILQKNYQLKTIKAVLSDLGYMFIFPMHTTTCDFVSGRRRCIRLKFK